MSDKREIRIKCSDNFELTATLYKPDQLKGAVVVAPATGIKKTFYNSFATFLSENNYGVISFENRGIGGSRGKSINGSNASLITWGELDMTAVLNELKSQFPNTSYHLVGHSAGGQLVGLMNNAKDIKSIFNFASSSGNMKNMAFQYRIKAKFFMNFFIPINNLVFGYTNSQWVGMGEPLPKAVSKQWSKWCNGAGYVETDFGKAIDKHLYDDITAPSLWLHATDDDIANYENVKDMVRVYSNSESEIMTLDPKELGYPEIGHMKFFSSKKKELWRHAIDWLGKFE